MFVKSPHLLMLAAGLVLASGAGAEAPKAAVPRDSARPAPVVLASADQVANTAPTAPQPTETRLKPHRAARVTTCRCGDPQPDAQDQQ